MKGAVCLALLGAVTRGVAEVLDLGQLDQYKPRLSQAPQLSGTTVWLSGTEGVGFDIAFSTDARNHIQDTLQRCGNDQNKCFEDVRQVLESADLQIDAQLERRTFLAMFSKSIKKWYDFFIYTVAYLKANWNTRNSEVQELGLFLPATAAAKASGLSDATAIVVSAEGSAVATITPTPDSTNIQGSSMPTVTPVTVADGEFLIGDLMLLMDNGLAQRIDEIMRRTTECEEGRQFDRDHPTKQKRVGGGTPGQALCGAMGVVPTLNGGPGSPLLSIFAGPMAVNFRDLASNVAQAADVLAQFIRDNAPLMAEAITNAAMNLLPVVLIIFAFQTIVSGNPLGGKERIPASLVTTTATPTATSTRTGCPNASATALICGFPDEQDCDVKLPDRVGDHAVCASGQYKDCECDAQASSYMSMLSPDQAQFVITLWNLFATIPKPPGLQPPPSDGSSTECKKDQMSDIPESIFGGNSNNVYHHFCDKWLQGQELSMTVDSVGNNKQVETHLGAAIRGRSPPSDASEFSHYNFNLHFKPTDKSKKCVFDCKAAFSHLTNACVNSGSKGFLMAKTGKIDVGCGIFDYTIEGPTVPLKFIERNCFKTDEFGKHADTTSQKTVGAHFTCFTERDTIKRGNASSNFNKPYDFGNGDTNIYELSIYWKDGCLLEFPGADEMDGNDPFKKGNHDDCQLAFTDNFNKCDNHDTGATAQVGCLIYETMVKPK